MIYPQIVQFTSLRLVLELQTCVAALLSALDSWWIVWIALDMSEQPLFMIQVPERLYT